MTFTVSNKTLGDALNLLIKVVSSKNVLPILDNFIFSVKDGELTLTAADTENMMTARISLSETSGEGDFAVNAKSMMDAVKNIADYRWHLSLAGDGRGWPHLCPIGQCGRCFQFIGSDGDRHC